MSLGHLLSMVTTTIYNGRLVRMGCKRWIVRDIADVQVEIGVDINGCDDYVLDILVGFDHTNVSETQVEQIRSEIAAKQNEIMAVFTLFSISCIPATVVGGLFGMNVKVPFMNDEDHESLYPFMVIVLAMLLSGVSFYLFFSWWLKNAE